MKIKIMKKFIIFLMLITNILGAEELLQKLTVFQDKFTYTFELDRKREIENIGNGKSLKKNEEDIIGFLIIYDSDRNTLAKGFEETKRYNDNIYTQIGYKKSIDDKISIGPWYGKIVLYETEKDFPVKYFMNYYLTWDPYGLMISYLSEETKDEVHELIKSIKIQENEPSKYNYRPKLEL